MRRRGDWGTWASLVIVALACVAIGWGFLPEGLFELQAWGREHHATAVPDAGSPAAPNPLGYRLSTPDSTTVLADSLSEISDLSLAKDGASLWAVHDEKGTLYRLGFDGAVVQSIDFHKKGDFESCARVGDQVFVGRSDGVVFVVDPQGGAATQFTTGLGKACNLEGMTYDSAKGRLLLACKSPLGEEPKRSWAIYAVDPISKELQKVPAFVITQQQLAEYLSKHPEQRELSGWMAAQLDPSGIAIDPKSGLITLISTRARLLLVLDAGGAILRIEKLERAVLPQPEGIAFLPDGTLFLSSEARGGHALLLRFSQGAVSPR